MIAHLISAFQYLSSEAIARRARLRAMLRITKTKGDGIHWYVPDVAKRELADSIRKISHQAIKKVSALNPDHLFYTLKNCSWIYPGKCTKIMIIGPDRIRSRELQGARYGILYT